MYGARWRSGGGGVDNRKQTPLRGGGEPVQDKSDMPNYLNSAVDNLCMRCYESVILEANHSKLCSKLIKGNR